MASPSDVVHQPHLVSLVLQSKKALQNGEQLCSRANDLSNASAQSAVDVLALDAKVRWITDGVLEQLRLATSIAKSIEEKRARLGRQVQACAEWDVVRAKHSDALDDILESLGSQLVPPDFHQHSAASSLFGSQHSEDEEETSSNIPQSPRHSLSSTIHNVRKEKVRPDRQTWKTLRDFVDDQAIEDVLEKMENERTTLDDILNKTDEYPETLNTTTAAIRESLPDIPPLPAMDKLLATQDGTITLMARHLESLAAHYDQMAGALHESEGGEAFSDEDLQAMNRDTDELPSIMNELDECLISITNTNELLVNSQEDAKKNLAHLHTILDDLDELGEIMTDMLQTQDVVEHECEEQLASLQQHLLTVEHLHERFVSYRTAFNKLMLEIARRRQYREAAENIVRGMMSQLAAMTEEESQVRDHFNLEHGVHLPEDICLCIGNTPTRWEVVPWQGEEPEVLPEIEADLIAQAKDRIAADAAHDTESL
ncbi:autophagy-related protein 17 [Mycena maculata]|uniref:Autophagy-related protein 17 n=1 Tax=Mycena maculata TaxID=230809 RepID=A0AAD7HSE7_9AGAR|nr:autophagy-related protein 17 [Mycena maculata]